MECIKLFNPGLYSYLGSSFWDLFRPEPKTNSPLTESRLLMSVLPSFASRKSALSRSRSSFSMNSARPLALRMFPIAACTARNPGFGSLKRASWFVRVINVSLGYFTRLEWFGNRDKRKELRGLRRLEEKWEKWKVGLSYLGSHVTYERVAYWPSHFFSVVF